MKRVLKGVHVLMAVGLIVALAACSGGNGSIKRERDQAQAAAAAAEAAAAQAAADKMAADAAAAQAEADKVAAEAAAAQAAADKMAADEAAAQAEADKVAAEAAAAQAAADKMAADDAAAAAAAQAAVDLKAAQDAAAAAAAQAAVDLKAAQDAAAAAAAQAAVALKAAQDAAAAAQAQAAVALKAAEDAAAAAAAQAALDLKAAQDALAAVPETIEELEAALEVANAANKTAQEDKAVADMALEKAIEAKEKAQAAVAAVDESDAAGLTDAIEALQMAREDEAVAEKAAMDAADVATDAEADVTTAQAAVDATDTGPASEKLTDQQEAADIKGAKAAFKVLAKIEQAADSTVTPALLDIRRNASAAPEEEDQTILSVTYDAKGLKFKVAGAASTTDPVWKKADTNTAPTIDGWVSDTYTAKAGTTAAGNPTTGRLAAGVTATAMVYSSIAAPEQKLFVAVHGPNPQLTGTAPDAADATGQTNANWKRAKIAPSATYGRASLDPTSPYSVEGSYDGVDGTFSCTGECPENLPLRKSDGSILTATLTVLNPENSTWKFKPTADAAEATVAVVDTSYLLFGYWLSKHKDDGPQEFAVWYGAGTPAKSTVATAGQITALDEKVEYTGVAAGKYVTKVDVENTAEAGYFTATAVLTADFTARAGTAPGTLEGTISDFNTGESDALGDLTLTLRNANLTHNEDADNPTLSLANAATNMVDAKVSGGSHKGIGGWEAQLFGDEVNTHIPTGVAGAFDAEIPNHAVVVGGFGAEER